MAKKTFSVTANGATAGQALDATSTMIKFRGFSGSGLLTIQVSDTDGDYVGIFQGPTGITSDAAYQVQIPGGWYVRVLCLAASGTPAITVVIE